MENLVECKIAVVMNEDGDWENAIENLSENHCGGLASVVKPRQDAASGCHGGRGNNPP